jgi:hypothetical protein
MRSDPQRNYDLSQKKRSSTQREREEGSNEKG